MFSWEDWWGGSELSASLLLQFKDEAMELEELREMKSDIERRERAQATVIENQAKRLEELETLYKVKNELWPVLDGRIFSLACKWRGHANKYDCILDRGISGAEAGLSLSMSLLDGSGGCVLTVLLGCAG